MRAHGVSGPGFVVGCVRVPKRSHTYASTSCACVRTHADECCVRALAYAVTSRRNQTPACVGGCSAVGRGKIPKAPSVHHTTVRTK